MALGALGALGGWLGIFTRIHQHHSYHSKLFYRRPSELIIAMSSEGSVNNSWWYCQFYSNSITLFVFGRNVA